MSTAVTPESVLRTIPGWEQATIKDLEGGLTNRSWLVESAGRRAVLKIDSEPRSAPYNSRAQEAQVQANAAEAGIANEVLYVAETVYMTEYVDGQTWSAGSLQDESNLLLLATALRTLHSMPLTGRTFDAMGAARTYAARIRTGDPGMVRDCIEIIGLLPLPRNLCCCHNDLVVANVIATPDVRFLDWEYACDNDPFFDLATVIAHHRMPADAAHFLLDAYFNGDGKRWRDYLDEHVRVYNALLWLWLQARAEL